LHRRSCDANLDFVGPDAWLHSRGQSTPPRRFVAGAVALGSPPIASTLPGYEIETWFGVLAAKDTASAIIAKLNAALTSVLASPDIKQRFFEIGAAAASTN